MTQLSIPKDKCSMDCPCYANDANEYFHEWCELENGTFTIEIKDGKLVKCPLGKW